MRNASTSESDDEVYNVFRVFSSLGLKMEGKGQSGSSRGWDLLLNQLLPTIPKEGAWTEQSLKYQCWEVRNNLAKHCDGLHSNSVIWGSILQHLLNRENKLFFLVAANLSKELQKQLNAPQSINRIPQHFSILLPTEHRLVLECVDGYILRKNLH